MKEALCLCADLLRAESVTSMAIVCQPGDIYNSRPIRYWPSTLLTLVRLKQPLVTPESADTRSEYLPDFVSYYRVAAGSSMVDPFLENTAILSSTIGYGYFVSVACYPKTHHPVSYIVLLTTCFCCLLHSFAACTYLMYI